MNDHPDRRISRRDFFRAAGTAAAALAALGLGGYALQRWDTAGAVDGASGSGSDRRHPVYQETFQAEGRTWRRKTNLESYLFLGIDTLGRAEGTQSYVAGGQADAQILLVVDHTARTWQMLQINRDSMVQVPVLSMMGTVPYTIRQQIALAHAYGNGREQSCENNVRAVSMLLGDQPIDGYLSMTMGGVGVLVDLLGGVTLTLGSDLSAVDPALTQGATVTLNGEQALAYVPQPPKCGRPDQSGPDGAASASSCGPLRNRPGRWTPPLPWRPTRRQRTTSSPTFPAAGRSTWPASCSSTPSCLS